MAESGLLDVDVDASDGDVDAPLLWDLDDVPGVVSAGRKCAMVGVSWGCNGRYPDNGVLWCFMGSFMVFLVI